MSKRKKKRIKYRNILLIGIVVILIIIISNRKPKEEIINADIVDEYVGKNITELETFAKDKSLAINKKYEYSKTIDKDLIISTNFNNNKVNVIVSKGIIDDNLYREKKVNELGNIPIMMYHGIVEMTDNKYTGGNIDKDGYNRTAKAFREDLEFYYQNGYRMIRLNDYINGIIDVPLGCSPIILTFDDGDKNNFNVLGKNDDGSLIIDPNSAVGILEEFKKKYSDFNVTATFFVMEGIFNQSAYNEEIVNWLVDHGYDVGNHTTIHSDFTTISIDKTQEVVGKMYQKLDNLLPNKYVKIVALPYGSPYKKTHENYPYILSGTYGDYHYETEAALRVGWEPEKSPFHKDFDKTFLKRCRAYDNDGKEFDIQMVFKNLERNRYISDGDVNTIVIKEENNSMVKDNLDNIITYKESE